MEKEWNSDMKFTDFLHIPLWCTSFPHFVVFVCRVVSHIACLEDTWSLLLESHWCTSSINVLFSMHVHGCWSLEHPAPTRKPQWLGFISVWDMLRTKLRGKKKWKTSKDWTKMVAGYAWKTFSSLSGSLSFKVGLFESFVLCANKNDSNTTTALLTVFFCSVNSFAVQVKLKNQLGWNTSFYWPTRESLGFPMVQLFTICSNQFTLWTEESFPFI